MDVTTHRSEAAFHAKSTVRIQELNSLLDHYANKIEVLSLDCFDTILWRRTASPVDVFLDLQYQPVCRQLQITDVMRVKGEMHAYHLEGIKKGTTQYKLEDVYRATLQNLTDEELQALIEEELTTEMASCYVLPAMIDFMRNILARGIKIIVVSNTYLTKVHLHRLLSAKLPHDVMEGIKAIFCSCDYGQSKQEGLFLQIIKSLKISPNAILHLGDHQSADMIAPRQAGMKAIHLIQHEKEVTELMRLAALSASFFDSTIRTTRALYNPFAGIIASGIVTETPENIIGYASLGPIFYSFAQWILTEVEKLKNAGKNPKVLFMLRDGYLPAMACEAFAKQAIGTQVDISRFVTVVCSFRTEDDVIDYIARAAVSLRFKDMCKQLLLSESDTQRILQQMERSPAPAREFAKMITSPEIMSSILKNAALYRQRFLTYLTRKANINSGDTVVLVDLGYSCTAQTMLAPILNQELRVEVEGLYLIAFRTYDRTSQRKGLLDQAHYDSNALKMLTTHISLFEQMCTSGGKSVIDYTDEGQPIFSSQQLEQRQTQKTQLIQNECLRFIRDADEFLQLSALELNADILRDAAAVSLARFIYFPTRTEIDYLHHFEHDVNFGTDEVLPMVDVDMAVTQLHRRSWLFCLQEGVEKMRMNYPAEFRAINIELSFALMAQHRFDLKLAATDLSHRHQKISLVTSQNGQMFQFPVEALFTHDGYYAVMVPVMPQQEIGVRFGLNYQWLELESAEIIPLEFVYQRGESKFTEDASQYLSGVQLEMKAGRLYECLSDKSLLVFSPPAKITTNNYVLRIVFRPVVLRKNSV